MVSPGRVQEGRRCHQGSPPCSPTARDENPPAGEHRGAAPAAAALPQPRPRRGDMGTRGQGHTAHPHGPAGTHRGQRNTRFTQRTEQPKPEGGGRSGAHGRTKPGVTPRPPRGTPRGQVTRVWGQRVFYFPAFLQKSSQADPFQTWWVVSEGKKRVGGSWRSQPPEPGAESTLTANCPTASGSSKL